MARRRRPGTPALGAALIGLLAPALVGCSTPAVEPTASPDASISASAAPLFASEEEALAAATEAYERYQAALDNAFSTYNVDDLEIVATGKALKEATDAVDGFKSRGHTQVGRAAVPFSEGVDLSTLFEHNDAGPVQIYACLDVSEVDVIDGSGASVSDADGLDLFPMLVSLTPAGPESRLQVSEESEWTGVNFC